MGGGGEGGGVAKEPRMCEKSGLKNKTLYCPNEFVHDSRLIIKSVGLLSLNI